MKLYANVDIVNRRLASHGMKGNNKKIKSHVAIGKKPLEDGQKEIFIMVSNTQQRQGMKFPIIGNIEQVFTRLVNEGKTTIRFKEPENDLCIHGDPIEVKSFLSVLKKVLSGQDVEKLTLSALQPLSNKQIAGPKRKLTVAKRSEYPVKEGFPQTLTHVKINGIRLAKIDKRILKLMNLTELDLMENEIEILPEDCEALTRLSILNVASNKINVIPRNLFSMNELTQLPPSLGNLSKLKILTATNNKIKFLPGSSAALRLEKLDISNNPWDESQARVVSNKLTGVSNLLELSACQVITHKIKYEPEDMFPQLLRYLESVMFCPCKKPIWNNVARAMVKLQLARISSSVSCNGLKEINMDAFLCSSKCLKTFIKMIDHSLELVKVTKMNLNKLEIVLVATLPVLYPASFFKSVLKGSNTAYLAVVDGKAVGCVVWRDEEQTSHLLALGVFILYRRRGIGSALLNLFVKQCKSKEIYLHVSAQNIDSILFYQHFGFSAVCRVPNYYRGLEENTAIKMLKMIS